LCCSIFIAPGLAEGNTPVGRNQIVLERRKKRNPTEGKAKGIKVEREKETGAIKLDFACYSPVYSNRHTSAEKKREGGIQNEKRT
jgi:hypothetical protein